MPHVCTNCGRTFPDGSKEMLSGCPNCGGNKFRYRPDGADADTDGADADAIDRAPPEPDDEGLPARDQGVVDRATTTVREWVGARSTPSGPADLDGASDSDVSARSDATSTASPDPVTDDPSDDSADATGVSRHGVSNATAADGVDPDALGSPESAADAESRSTTDPSNESASGSADAPEDTAQADARAGVADPSEIPDPPLDGEVDGNAPDLAPAEERAAAVADPSADDPTDPEHAADKPADPTATPAASNLAQLREELNEQFESIKIVEPGEYELNLMGLYDREEYIISLMEDGRYAIEVPETWRDSEDRAGE